MTTQKKKVICWSLIAAAFLFTGFQLNAAMLSNVFGKVINGETGEPVKGVLVCLTRFYVCAKTDKNGKFVIPNVPPGQQYIGFDPPPPYAYEREEIHEHPIMIREGKNLFFLKKLKYGGTLEMDLFETPSNTPLKKVLVNIKGAFTNRQYLRKDRYSDDNGKFKLDQLDAGKYTINIRADGYGMKILKDIDIQAKQTTSLQVPFDTTSPARVTGQVICESSSEQLKDIEVIVERIDQYGWAYTYTNESGFYSMFDLEPGLYEITISGIKKVNGQEEDFLITKKAIIKKEYPASVNFTVDCTLEYDRKRKE